MTRPSTYNQTYCNEVISAGEQGLSLTAFAGQIGVSRKTVYNWIKTFPEFDEAVNQAKAKAALFWETKLIQLASTGLGSATAIIFALKNRCVEDWRDRVDVDHTTAGEPIQNISDMELARNIAFTLAKASSATKTTDTQH